MEVEEEGKVGARLVVAVVKGLMRRGCGGLYLENCRESCRMKTII